MTAVLLLLTGVLQSVSASEPVPAADGNGWTLTVRPYLWNAGIKGSVDSPDGGGGPGGGVDFGSDYQFFTLENLDGVLMVALEAARGPWRLHLDGLYIAYEDRLQTFGGRVQSTLSLDGEIVEAAVERAIPGLSLSALAGARWQRLGTSVRVNDLEWEDKLSWTDPIFGLAYRRQWTERWDLAARGDVGGFTLGSRLAYRLEGELGYAFTRWLRGSLGYRHLVLDYRVGDTRLDLTLTGWMLGLGASF